MRVNLYLLLPICLVFAVFLVSQGMIQNFKPYRHGQAGRALHHPGGQEGRRRPGRSKDAAGQARSWKSNKVETQTIAQGPMASQVAIKMLGTNGGGFINANAAHPFENPTPLSNFLQMLSIFAIAAG